jgi:adenylate kinase
VEYEVIYLTGAPASGKSSLTSALSQAVRPLEIFEYGQRLTAYLQDKNSEPELRQTQVREKSATLVTPNDIANLDRILLAFVAQHRTQAHVIVDTHAVTKERYGFRVTPFRLSAFAELAPTQIWMLYTEPQVALRWIASDARGRPQISEWDASLHTGMQASLAITYAASLGIPVHLFNTDGPVSDLVSVLVPRFRSSS